MKTHLFFIVLAITSLDVLRGQRTTGKLFLLGGATSDDSSSIYNAIREATEVLHPKIAVVISAAPSLEDGLDAYFVSEPGWKSYEQLFIDYGFDPSVVYLAIDNYEGANSNTTTLGRENIEKIRSADAIFFNGGDQSRHSRAWLEDDGSDTEIMVVLRDRFSKGAVIAGTSAGMAVQGEQTFGSGTSYGYYFYNGDLKQLKVGEELADDRDPNDEYRYDENGAYVKGFGFLTDALVDTHFDARGRFGRLIVAMRSVGVVHGFGVDEDTALYIHNDVANVYGTWGVWIIDKTTETIPDAQDYFASDNIRIHYLTEGDSYNVITKEVTSTKAIVTSVDGIAYASISIFGRDQGLRSIKSLVVSNSNVSRGLSRENNPTCEVVFEKDERTRSYVSESQYTIANLLLHMGAEGLVTGTPSTETPHTTTPNITTPSTTGVASTLGTMKITITLTVSMTMLRFI
ncbi:Cyanophycinase [Pseudolycoriella hygida]|uniref:Cyanophycinase n=1 Tax=Pseudolycoriella hygida TaxID=35572 RepID=A0A9Q0S4L9_9DIPT|nr:Cyanophycinase [Pseudolycoriella hygida]